MKRTIVGLAFAALLGVGSTWAVDEKKPEKESASRIVMKKVNSKGGFAVIANNELKAEKPDWDKVAAAAKEITPLVDAMAKTTREAKAEKWAEMTKAYADAAKAFEKAAAAKDKEAAQKAFAGLTKCAGCHREFSNYSPPFLPKE